MNVLFVIEYYIPHIGGVEIVFKHLAEGLVKNGHDVTIVTSKITGTEKYEEINGVKIHRIPVPKANDRHWFTFLSIKKVCELAKDADIIHTTTYNAAFSAWIAGKLCEKPTVITVHEIFGSMWKNLAGMGTFGAKLYQLFEKIIIALPFDRYICVSRYTRNSLRLYGIKDNKLSVIYNGIDYAQFNPEKANGIRIREKLGIHSNDFIYCSFGRPGISKGIEYLIEAVPLVAKKMTNSKLLLILADDPKDRYLNIKQRIKELCIEDKVILLDPVPRNELPNYIAASDCVIVPSLSEGFGFTAAEACAMNKPVVSTDAGSLPEVVSGEYILIPPRNSEAIADAVLNVFTNNVPVNASKKFQWNDTIGAYAGIYEDLL